MLSLAELASGLAEHLHDQPEAGEIGDVRWLELGIDGVSFVFLHQPVVPNHVTVYGQWGPVVPATRERLMSAALEWNFVNGHRDEAAFGFSASSDMLVSVLKAPLAATSAPVTIERLRAVVRQVRAWATTGLITQEEQSA